MRCNQVSIFIERFGEYVPKDYPADVQVISVYCDDFKSIYAALAKAYAMTVNELAQYENIGAAAEVHTNEFSRADYREMHNTIPISRTKYEEDLNLEYSSMRMQLYKDLVWVYEHSGELMDVIKQSKDESEMKAALRERFSLNEYQVKKISQIRLEMLTEKEYRFYKDEIERMERLKKS